MTWLVTLLCAASAAGHLAWVVPRLPEPTLTDGDPAPRYATLARGRHVALLALAALVLSQVLHGVPVEQFGAWFGYLGAGAALVSVDLRTTWLPRTLNLICVAQVALGLVWVAVVDWPMALSSVAGGAAALLIFHLVWRHSTTFGYGDVRLAAIVGALGALGGLDGWLVALLCGTLLGAVWGIAHGLYRRRHPGPAHFAYGPALWLGPILALVVSGW